MSSTRIRLPIPVTQSHRIDWYPDISTLPGVVLTDVYVQDGLFKPVGLASPEWAWRACEGDLDNTLLY